VARRARTQGVGQEGRLSPFHEEVLPPPQRAALLLVGRRAAAAGFYLGGGTAVAAHLGHRESLDFDWFTPAALDEPLAARLTRLPPGR
jgi:hypothetical protein